MTDRSLLAPDRVLLLLSLIPYLREHGATPVAELAEAFRVKPALLRSLVRFLGTAGVPGETLSYQHEDLFDIDWDALELNDVVSLTRTIVVDDAPRFAPSETAALVAGLHALSALLSEEDAALARGTADKLASALGHTSVPGMSVSADPEDPRVAGVMGAIDRGTWLSIEYRDAAGNASSRRIKPLALTQGAASWYVRAFCSDRRAERTFRVDHIRELQEVTSAASVDERTPPETAPGLVHSAELSDDANEVSIIARVRERALTSLQGYDPEVIEQCSPDWVRVKVAAWHSAAAIRLALLAPGDVVVESPAAATDLVRDWAARSLLGYEK